MKSKVYVFDVSVLNNEDVFSRSLHLVPQYRRDAAAAFVQLKDRALSLGAGLLLKRACEDAGISGADEHTVRLPGGKPVLRDFPQVHFSLSHSGKWAMCGISSTNIGCDVEKVQPYNEKLALKVCSDSELSRISQLSDEEKAGEFIRMWTLKESYMKFTGEGLLAGAKSIDFDFCGDVPTLHAFPQLHFFRFNVDSGYSFSCCTESCRCPELEKYTFL